MNHVPEDSADACEEVLYSFDRDGNLNVREVFVKASCYDELSEKMKKVKKLSPDSVVLNGTARSLESVMDNL